MGGSPPPTYLGDALTEDKPTKNIASPDWREVVQGVDSVAHEKMSVYMAHVFEKNAIPEMFRELMIFSNSASTRDKRGMLIHGERAVAAGATTDQLFQAGALAALSGGFPCLVATADVLTDFQAEGTLPT